MPTHSSDQDQKLEALSFRDVVDVLRKSVDQRQGAFHELDAVNRGPPIRPQRRVRGNLQHVLQFFDMEHRFEDHGIEVGCAGPAAATQVPKVTWLHLIQGNTSLRVRASIGPRMDPKVLLFGNASIEPPMIRGVLESSAPGT